MLGAAEGMAKGGGGSDGAMHGMGMGMGFGMAQMFMQQPAAAAPAQPPLSGPRVRLPRRRRRDTRSPGAAPEGDQGAADAGVLTDEEYKAKRAELMKLL